MVNDKAFYTKIAQLAEKASETSLVTLLNEATMKYNDAVSFNSPLLISDAYLDIKVLSYIVITKSLGVTSEQFLKEMESIEKVLSLIHPPQN
jgi:hypothetical protein